MSKSSHNSRKRRRSSSSDRLAALEEKMTRLIEALSRGEVSTSEHELQARCIKSTLDSKAMEVSSIRGRSNLDADSCLFQKMDQRICIKFCVKNKIKCADAFRMLTVAYGEATLDRSNVYRWYKMFSEGREDVNDEERAGRPSTSTTDENIDEVKKIVLANRRITVREVAEDLNISIGSCHSIFTNDLGTFSEHNAIYIDVPLYCEIRWLNTGKCLEKFFTIKKEIFLFLQDQVPIEYNKFKFFFEDLNSLCELALITDQNSLVISFDSFCRELTLFKNYLENNNLSRLNDASCSSLMRISSSTISLWIYHL
ncbi:hypothetical protein ALC56_01348 [Trachymyrmex septentrionalis]|uniref:Mos1 transposase HTH domain-containing protein n=1 Tax=Trachymyrmex septentrionalis TaxID=34720 RepID=A0A151K0Y7_9HYME|nr:hypothetical protein ALC56_01348 [Trachymyrmex septentrionalis]